MILEHPDYLGTSLFKNYCYRSIAISSANFLSKSTTHTLEKRLPNLHNRK